MKLKVRAWDPLTNPPRMMDYIECNEHTLDYLMSNELEVMLYTGKKDLNKKEICESDIVKEKNHIGFITYDDLNRKTFYYVNCIDFEGSPFGLGIPLTITKYTEIIGNKYENPDLWKELRGE